MKKTGLLCLAVMLALGTLGVGYAMWDKTLYIDATVHTGEVNMKIISVASDDPPGTIDRGKDKDVGWTEVIIDPMDDQRMLVTIHNGYPCYEVYLHFTGHNNGTIPVKLQDIIVTVPPELSVSAWDGMGEQVDPGENCDNSASVHVEQEAEELTTYTFTVEFYYVQWNEYH
ncbi:hypothetical protein ACFLYG_02190 [Chloroflexota bacterium]